MNGMFYGCSSLKSLNLSNFNTESTKNMAFMFYKLSSVKSLDISNFNTPNVEYMYFMFYGCESITYLDISNFNTHKIKIMDGMFSYCSSLVVLNLSNFNTSEVISMEYLFKGCSSLISIDLSNFDTSLTTTFDYMFAGCSSLQNLDLYSFDTSSVVSMKSLFCNCSSLINLNLEFFNTSYVTNMDYMFSGCNNLISVNLNYFNTTLTRTMKYMFSNCSSLKKVNISNIDTTSLIDAGHMFENCISLTEIYLPLFNSSLQNIEYMFANDINLVFVHMDYFDESNIQKMDNMFLSTPENMVFCLNDSISSKINNIIKKKACTIIDCSANWKNSRMKIIHQTKTCVEECPSNSKFFNDYTCVFRCPDGSFPDNFVCKTLLKDDNDNENKTCNIRNFFLGFCNMKLYSQRQKQKFIEQVNTEILNGGLYDLVISAIDKKYRFTIRDGDEIYQIYSLSDKFRESDLVYIDFQECGKALRNKNKMEETDDIVIFQIEYRSSDFMIPIVEYNLYGLFGTQKLSLSPCNNMKLRYYIPKKINNFERYKYDIMSDYYNDKCYPFTTENNTDITIKDRKNEFNNNNMSLCESSCNFKGYLFEKIECECQIKNTFGTFLNVNNDKYNLIHRFKINNTHSSNFWVLQCYSLIFSKEIILSNYCSIIILGIILIILLGAIVFRIKGHQILMNKINIVIKFSFKTKVTFLVDDKNKNQNQKNVNVIVNRFNRQIKHNKSLLNNSNNLIGDQSSKKVFARNYSQDVGRIIRSKINNFKNKNNNNTKYSIIKEDVIKFSEITDNELNSLSYYDAIVKDKRTFCQFYFSLIRTKQLLAFTFKCKNDYNSRIIKFCFFLFIFALIFFINTTFIDDLVLHNLFISQGYLDIFSFITRNIYTTIIISTIKNILLEFIFTEDDILSIKNGEALEKNQNIHSRITAVELRCILFFILSLVLLSFMWFYIACFFTVFKNTQIFAIKNALINLGLFLMSPFAFCMIPAALRIISLESREKKSRVILYIISKIIQILI